jgi:Domain of unknown function (DUF5655)
LPKEKVRRTKRIIASGQDQPQARYQQRVMDCGARRRKESEEDSPEKYLAAAPKYVAEQYSGKKEALRPVYENVLQVAAKLGADVKACPGKTSLPLYRNHLFAQLRPTTNTRLDLGLSRTHYKGKLPKRLLDTAGMAKKDALPTGSN